MYYKNVVWVTIICFKNIINDLCNSYEKFNAEKYAHGRKFDENSTRENIILTCAFTDKNFTESP